MNIYPIENIKRPGSLNKHGSTCTYAHYSLPCDLQLEHESAVQAAVDVRQLLLLLLLAVRRQGQGLLPTATAPWRAAGQAEDHETLLP